MQRGGILVDEHGRDPGGGFGIRGFGARQEQRNVGLLTLDPGKEGNTGVILELTVLGVANVGDDSEEKRQIPLIKARCLLKGLGRQDLGACPHGEQLVLFIQPLFHHCLRLLHDLAVEHGQQGG